MVEVTKENFSAWIDKMPGSEPTFIVSGDVTVPTGGWKANLSRAEPQGINPSIIVLDLGLQQPSGPATQAITTIKARYEESPPANNYTEAMIRHASGEFSVQVKKTV